MFDAKVGNKQKYKDRPQSRMTYSFITTPFKNKELSRWTINDNILNAW